MVFTQEFRTAMMLDGIVMNDEIIADGNIHRFHVNGDSAGSLNGWYVLYVDGIASGAFGCWKHGINNTWCAKNKNEMSSQELAQHYSQIKAAKEQRTELKKKLNANAREASAKIWNESVAANNNHPYLALKKVKSYRLRVSKDGHLIVRICDTEGNVHSLQFISENGDKSFLFGGAIKGHYFSIGKPIDTIYLCEGYATGATIHEATGCGVVIAFNAGNLLAVAQTIRHKYTDKKLIICADNDQWTPSNPGLTKAQEAAKIVNAEVVFPCFDGLDTSAKSTDFNDLGKLAGIEEVKRQLIDNQKKSEEWPEPESIQTQLLPVEPLPIAIIPEPFRDWVTDIAERMQCPIDFIAVTAMIVTASVVGTSCGIKPKKEDSWLVIPNLWGCIVGRPGIMKTPAVSEVMKLLDNLQSESKKELATEIQRYNVEIETYKATREAIKSSMTIAQKSKLKNNTNSPELSLEKLKKSLFDLKEPVKPIWRRFKTNDSTVEKLSELLAENPRGLLIYRDELVGFLKTCEKAGHEGDRTFFLEAWNGDGSQTTDRIGRGTIHTENLCISLFGTTQPDKLLRYLYSAVHGDNDGLIQRFQLLIFPDEPKDWKKIDRSPNSEARTRVTALIAKLSTMNFIHHGAKQEGDARFPYFRFTEDAQEQFYQWWEDLERNKLRSDEHPIMIEHLSKYRKLMPTLALLFHLIGLADGKQDIQISAENVQISWAWCNYLESHARRVYALVTDIEVQAARMLAEKIKQGKLKDDFTVREIYRQNWSVLNNKVIVQAACEELIDAGWLRKIKPAPEKGSKSTYVINPKLKIEGKIE